MDLYDIKVYDMYDVAQTAVVSHNGQYTTSYGATKAIYALIGKKCSGVKLVHINTPSSGYTTVTFQLNQVVDIDQIGVQVYSWTRSIAAKVVNGGTETSCVSGNRHPDPTGNGKYGIWVIQCGNASGDIIQLYSTHGDNSRRWSYVSIWSDT